MSCGTLSHLLKGDSIFKTCQNGICGTLRRTTTLPQGSKTGLGSLLSSKVIANLCLEHLGCDTEVAYF